MEFTRKHRVWIVLIISGKAIWPRHDVKGKKSCHFIWFYLPSDFTVWPYPLMWLYFPTHTHRHTHTHTHTPTPESLYLLSQGLSVSGSGFCCKAQALWPSSLPPQLNIHSSVTFLLPHRVYVKLKNH